LDFAFVFCPHKSNRFDPLKCKSRYKKFINFFGELFSQPFENKKHAMATGHAAQKENAPQRFLPESLRRSHACRKNNLS
jgi:hypothetical protein